VKISVVIPAYNEEKSIDTCLNYLVNQEEKPDEIIVVDNNCTDKTAEIAKKYGARVITEEKQGMIPARNKGYNSAQYEIIARTDADTHVPKNWIKLIKENFAKNKNLLGLSGPANFYNFPINDKLQYSQWENKAIFAFIKSQIKHDTLYGPNHAIRKSAWEKVKNEVCLDDKSVHEDVDLAIHLGRYGEIKIDPKLVVNTSFRRFKKPFNYFDYSRKLITTFRKHNLKVIAVPYNTTSYTYDGIGPIDVFWKEFRSNREIYSDTAIIYLPGWSLNPSSKSVEKLCKNLAEKLNIRTYALHTKPKNIQDDSLFFEAKALKKLIQELNPTIKKIVLITHSQGTVKTIHLAHMLSEDLNYEIKGIICITPVGLYKFSKRELQINFLGEAARTIYGSFKEILHKNRSATDLVKGVLSYVKNEIKERKLSLYAKRLRQQTHELASAHPMIVMKLQEIKSKIVFILADKDLVSSVPRIKKTLNETNMQNVRIFEEKNAIHGLPYLRTEVLTDVMADLVRDFLQTK
jgi:glycosyltransferase involved in cell wall biosynthesis